MKSILSIAAALAVSAAFIQAEEPKKAEKPEAGAAFEKKDTNKDGSISKEEFVAGAKDAAKAEAAFAKKDKDNDGKLSKEEFASRGGAEKKK